MKMRTPHAGKCLAALTIGLVLTLPAQADELEMPPGGTSWIEASSTHCDVRTPALGADCFGSGKLMPTAEYSLRPPRSFIAGGQVNPDHVSLLNTGKDGGGFAWGATGGQFMVHGSGVVPVPVTATLKVTGSIEKNNNQLTQGSAGWKIGSWVFGDVTSDLNQRVVGSVGDGVFSRFNEAGSEFDRVLTFAFKATPGQEFNLGYQLTTSTRASGESAVVTVSALGSFSVQVGEGYFVTGGNGYDSRVSAVPEPETYAMFLAGLGLLGGIARRRKLAA
jgi:hypothetical protein